MLNITYSRKAKIVDGGFLYVPFINTGLKQLITDSDYFRCQSKFRSYANSDSDLVENILQRALYDITFYCDGFNPEYPPAGVTVKYRKSASIPMVQVTIDLEYEHPVPSEELFIWDNGNLPLGLGVPPLRHGDSFQVTASQAETCKKLLAAGFSEYLHNKNLRLAYRKGTYNESYMDGEAPFEMYPMHLAVQKLEAGDFDAAIFCNLVDRQNEAVA